MIGQCFALYCLCCARHACPFGNVDTNAMRTEYDVLTARRAYNIAAYTYSEWKNNKF